MDDTKTLSCFYCKHLILDGCGSWCDVHIAGEVCEDYDFNLERFNTVKKYEKIRNEMERKD